MSCSPNCTPVARPELPRDQWAAHPRYPQQILLLGSHANFLRISDLLLRRALQANGAPDEHGWRAPTAQLFEAWQSAMANHERYEELKLYRFLERRFEARFDELEAGHRRLHRLAAAVRRALADGSALQEGESLRNYHHELEAHLDAEEQLVIPMLLALEPVDFRHFTHSSPRELAACCG
jgi:hypothetical protein